MVEPLDEAKFKTQFERFQKLVAYHDKGQPFAGFSYGVAGVWEAYKPRLRAHALKLLDSASWSTDQIGSGRILEKTIAAIEVDDSAANLRNNLVFWQNRFGHANKVHRALLEAETNQKQRKLLEAALYELFRGTPDFGATFDHLADLTNARYPLLAYFFFLRDMDRFMPILPTTFDAAFRDLGIDLVTQRNCSWANYVNFNEALGLVRDALRTIGGVKEARLIDAHSFCWLLERLEEPPEGATAAKRRGPDAGRILGPREKSLVDMRLSVLKTVAQSRGQIEERVVKIKDLRMTEGELDDVLKELMELQKDRCALTGLPFQFLGPQSDKNLLPSVDRIDSSGHYERGNLQLVCRFINFWKQDSDNEEFKRLLLLVRGVEE